jgi:seryl-tRNA synthetase
MINPLKFRDILKMLDQKLLRTRIDEVAKRLAIRGYVLDVNKYQELEAQRKSLQTKTEQLLSDRNRFSKEIGVAKQQGLDAAPHFAEMTRVNESLATVETELRQIQTELDQFCALIPNIPHESVPEGQSEDDNVEIRRVGEPPQFSFTPKDHVDLGIKNNAMDFITAAKLSSARFVVLRGQLARVHRALIQFMLDIHTEEHGYQEVYVPYLVNQTSLFGTGQLPKMADDLFMMSGEDPLALIPTAEVPVTNLVRDTIVDGREMPLRYVCHTPCFRSEAGSHGKDTRGMIRQHQFEKVELVQIVHPEHSYRAHEELTQHAETILQRLGLAYRVVVLCGADLGFCSAKTYDLEVWLPGQQRYREISSCSNFETFQARRLQARFRDSQSAKPELAHTINGSGLAIGRTLVAILENFQDAEGRVHLPVALWPYTSGLKVIDFN